MHEDDLPDSPAATPGFDEPGSWDAALARLEDVLLGLPEDRALPDLEELLRAAKVSRDVVRQDDRALKLLREAMLARPLSDPDEVTRIRNHVEMMTLEVEVLTERIRAPETDPAVAARALARLDEIRVALAEVRDDL